jgi:hypothetical protein
MGLVARASDRPQVNRAGCRLCRLPASSEFIRQEPFVGAMNHNPNFRIRRRGRPGPFVAAMRVEIGGQGGPPQVVGRLEQGRTRIFLPLSLSSHGVHGLLAIRSHACCNRIEPAALARLTNLYGDPSATGVDTPLASSPDFGLTLSECIHLPGMSWSGLLQVARSCAPDPTAQQSHGQLGASWTDLIRRGGSCCFRARG